MKPTSPNDIIVGISSHFFSPQQQKEVNMTDSDYDDNKDESPAEPADGSPDSEIDVETDQEDDDDA